MSNRIGLVIPSYNESLRLPAYINDFLNQGTFLQKHNIFVHILIVDDGSRTADWEKTRQNLEALTNKFPADPKLLKIEWFRREQNRGKGYSVKEGFLKLKEFNYDALGFADADGAVDAPSTLTLAVKLLGKSATDILIGSRWKALGYKIERSFKRHLSGRIFVTLLNMLFDIPVYDSQCGAKFFKKNYFESPQLFEICDDEKWFFDTQLIILAYRRGYRIEEVPVNWIDQAGSKVSLIKDSIRMVLAMLRFKDKLKKLNVTQK